MDRDYTALATALEREAKPYIPEAMYMSASIDKLAAALAKAQGQLKPAAKDSTNPHFKSKYADLASIDEASRDVLARNGLSVVQLPRADGRKVTLIYVLMHESGQYIGSDLTMTAQQDTPQAVGSCITYQRRYTKAALVGISQDDDDGNHATQRHDPDPIVSYDGKTHALKNELLAIAKHYKITAVEDLQRLSQACIGMPMSHLDDAVREWANDHRLKA